MKVLRNMVLLYSPYFEGESWNFHLESKNTFQYFPDSLSQERIEYCEKHETSLA